MIGEAGDERPDLSRDRDPSGRPRNARPRDDLGRPLPRTADDRHRAGPNEPARDPFEALQAAQALLDGGRPFAAHEVLEDQWKHAEAVDRDLWRGLAQLAVAATHALRGNDSGARSLRARGADSLTPYLGSSPYDVDVKGLVDWARADHPETTELPPLTARGTETE